MKVDIRLYRSLNAVVTQSKNCTFTVNNTIELKNIKTTSGSDDI